MGFSILDFFSGGSWGPCSGGSGENGFSRIAPAYFTIKRAELNTHTRRCGVPKAFICGSDIHAKNRGRALWSTSSGGAGPGLRRARGAMRGTGRHQAPARAAARSPSRRGFTPRPWRQRGQRQAPQPAPQPLRATAAAAWGSRHPPPRYRCCPRGLQPPARPARGPARRSARGLPRGTLGNVVRAARRGRSGGRAGGTGRAAGTDKSRPQRRRRPRGSPGERGGPGLLRRGRAGSGGAGAGGAWMRQRHRGAAGRRRGKRGRRALPLPHVPGAPRQPQPGAGPGPGAEPQPEGAARAMAEQGAPAAAVPNGGSAARPLGNKVTVVLGAQWGDEGKGKVVDLLAQDADIVCRCQVRRGPGRGRERGGGGTRPGGAPGPLCLPEAPRAAGAACPGRCRRPPFVCLYRAFPQPPPKQRGSRPRGRLLVARLPGQQRPCAGCPPAAGRTAPRRLQHGARPRLAV